MRSGSPQITAVLIGATVLAAVVAFLAIRSGGDGDEPVATPAPSVGAAVTVDPSELTTGGDGPLTGPVDGGFTRMELAPGETPPRPYGIVFADAETGASEFWWVEDAEDSQPEYYLVDSTHRWLQFFDYQEPRILIADRETRETYEHNPDRWNLIAGPSAQGVAVFQRREPGEFAVVDLSSDPMSVAQTFELPGNPNDLGPPIALLGDGNHLRSGKHLVDLGTGEVTEVPLSPDAFTVTFPLADGGRLDVMVSGSGREPTVTRQRYDAGGGPVDYSSGPTLQIEPRAGPFDGSFVASPDGRWLTLGTGLDLTSPAFTDVWPALLVADLEGESLAFRALRVSHRSTFKSTFWLADGSGIVVATPDGFAVLQTDGSLQALPFGPVEQAGVAGVPAPVPAPHDAALFLYRGAIVDATGQSAGPTFAAADWASTEPWNDYGFRSDGAEVRFVQSPAPGRDIGLTVLTAFGLPAKVEPPPFPAELRLQIVAPEGVELRSEPRTDAGVVGQLSPRAVVTVTDSETPPMTSAEPDQAQLDGSTFGWVYDVPWWVHVRAEDGAQGWVLTEHVAWAD